MHQLKLSDSIPTVTRIQQIITAHNDRFGIPMDYDRMLEYYAYYTLRSHDLMQRVINTIYVNGNKPSVSEFKDTQLRMWLTSACVKGLKTTKGGNISVAKDSLEAAAALPLNTPEQATILRMCAEAKSCAKKVDMFRRVFEIYPVVGIETWDNHRMIVVRPVWEPQNTNRLGAKEPAVINFAKDVGDIFTIPKGFIYFEADSGQIEPRTIQSWVLQDPVLKACTMAYNDAYFGYVHYCKYLTDEQRQSGDTQIKCVELTDEQIALRKKFKKYGNAVMYGSTENDAKDPDKDLFIKYIGGHPSRVKMQHDIERRIENGQRIFYTAFGTPIDITKGPSENEYQDKSSDAYFKHLVRCAINNPVQGTAADLMRYSVIKADSLLTRKAPSSIILQYVHDAGKFMIAESDYDKVIDELKEITAYQVEDWIPIYCDPAEGVHTSELKRFLV